MELLKPINSNVKSYYGKAKIERLADRTKLYSYGTLVAEIVNGNPIVHGFYSATTLRHIKEFFSQHGINAVSKKEMSEYLIDG